MYDHIRHSILMLIVNNKMMYVASTHIFKCLLHFKNQIAISIWLAMLVKYWTLILIATYNACLSVAGGCLLLAITIIIVYPITRDKCSQGRRSRLLTIRPID